MLNIHILTVHPNISSFKIHIKMVVHVLENAKITIKSKLFVVDYATLSSVFHQVSLATLSGTKRTYSKFTQIFKTIFPSVLICMIVL